MISANSGNFLELLCTFGWSAPGMF